MKTRLWMILAPALLAWPALAAGPASLDVTAADLAAAGAPDVTTVNAANGRFEGPVRYFRTSEKLSVNDARLDCADCDDLIAVYAADVPDAPKWAEDAKPPFIKIGGRLQLRTYIPSKKRIVTVTAISEATLRKISSYLVAKFSK
jgi:hypothetical protein